MAKARNLSAKNQQDSMWKRKSSYVLALAVASATAAQVYAQDAETTDESDAAVVEEVVVTGMRQSLMNAQEIKRDAATVMESITAEDLGSFPDKSIAEALQRVAGVTVNRFAATGDTAHFSAEPSGVVVRGLNQVRTEFNGRTSFSANSSRGLSWTDVSPELMAGVDTYKNQMAELIEGGIAGTVNMRTRVPFDQEGQMFAMNLSQNWGDLSRESTPEASALYSNRWETGIGEFGFLANLAYSEVSTRSQGIQLGRMNRFRDVYPDVSLAFIPGSVTYRDNLYDRERQGVALAAQWQDLDEKVVATFQYNRSQYQNAWEEYLVTASPAALSYGQSIFYEIPNGSSPPQPAPGTDPFTFDENGLFQTGVMTSDIGWWGSDATAAAGFGANSAGQPFVNPCYDWAGCSPNRRGADMGTGTRTADEKKVTEDFGFNLKWSPTENMRANLDAQYVKATVENYDIEVGYSSYANVALDMSGEHPVMEFLYPPTNVNLSPGVYSNPNPYTNPNNYYIHHIMDHIEDSEGEQVAVKGDFEFDFDSDWMESVKVGARYAKREQDLRWSGYNWQNVANTWTDSQAPYHNLDKHEADEASGFNGYPMGHYQGRSFDSNFLQITPQGFVFANADLLADRDRMAETMSASALGFTGGAGWDPICSGIGDRASELENPDDECFDLSEVGTVTEETQAIYAQLNFGGPNAEMFGIPFSGNLGVRYVRTEVTSVGGVAYPDPDNWDFIDTNGNGVEDPEEVTWANRLCETIPPDNEGNEPPVPQTIECYLQQNDFDFMNSGWEPRVAVVEHTNVLPSFNLKLDMTDEWVLRFALSKAMARPDMGNLKNYTGIGKTLPTTDSAENPLWVKDVDGNIVEADARYSGSAQNAYLEPIVALQSDISLEWYFDDVGYVTLAVFAKDFENYIQHTTLNETYTNNGYTQTAEIRRPVNGDGAKISGFEFAFQRYFDFLPAPFDGFGVQANYTYINNQGIENTNTSNVGDGSTDVEAAAPDQVAVDQLEGLSEDSYNLVALYEKDKFAARLAYSWRSEYLVTAIDCCVLMPMWQQDYGQLDGSISYELNDNITVRFQGSNLTNEETVLRQQTTNAEDGALTMPGSWFQNDRRYTLTLSMTY